MSEERKGVELVPVEVCGEQIQAGRDGEEVWVSIRHVCEVIGVNPKGQQAKLKTKRWAVTEMNSSTGSDGKTYEMLCINLRSLPMWLATIEPGRSITPDLTKKLERFQLEAAEALAKYFLAPRPALPTPSPPELPPLRHGDRYLTVSDMVGQACIDEERLVEIETRLDRMHEILVAFGYAQERVTGETSKRVDELSKLVNVIDERCRASSAELVRLRDRLEDTREDVANLRGALRALTRRVEGLEKARGR